MKKTLIGIGIFLAVVLAAAVIASANLNSKLEPMPVGAPQYLRFERGTTLAKALTTLEAKGIIRSADAAEIKLKWLAPSLPKSIHDGTFELAPGMTLETVMKTLQKPMRRMVAMPEGWWIKRVAERLEKQDVCPAMDYIELASHPEEFAKDVSFKLPEKSLEGYLYPDTYDLPPLIGARKVISLQLKNFEKKVIEGLKLEPGPELDKALIEGSIIELEAAKDEERPRIAGVIENRLKLGMRLEMDASVLYGIQQWRVLKPGEVRKLESPYNTYLHDGLPPGPIGSPTVKSIEGALHPEKHEWLYYVARPTRTHYFSKEYADHISAIKKARAEFAAQNKPQ